MHVLEKRLFLLVPFLLFFSLIPIVYGDDFNSELIMVSVDKSEYFTGDSITVMGQILEKKMPVIAMRVYDPSDDIISANSLEINDDDTFSKTFFLDEPFFEKKGDYKITFAYGKEKTQMNFLLIDKNSDPVIEEDPQNVEIISLVSDKEEYTDDDNIVITGSVSSISEPTVLVGIYDIFGSPTGFYFGEIDSNLEFSVSFLAKKDVNFKTLGTYSAVAYYDEFENSVTFNFVELEDNVESTNETIFEETDDKSIDADDGIVIENKKDDEPLDSTQDEKKNERAILTYENSKESNTSAEQISNKQILKKSTIPPNNLSVEDIELGNLLNQIVLNCDDSHYTDSIIYYDGMGPAMMRLCNFNDAISYFDKSLLEDPNNVEILTNKGSALSKLGYHDEAILFYDSALKINPNFLPAINNKANALSQLGHFEQAISDYNFILELDPTFTVSLQNLETSKKLYVNNDHIIINIENNSLSPINQITNKVVDTTIETVNTVNENPSNVLDQLGVVFSMIGSTFSGFLSLNH